MSLFFRSLITIQVNALVKNITKATGGDNNNTGAVTIKNGKYVSLRNRWLALFLF